MNRLAGRSIRDPIFDNFSWILLAGVAITAGFLNPTFFSPANLTNLLLHSVILGILVLAESVCLIVGRFDLTVEASLIFTAVVAAWLVSSNPEASGWQLPWILAALAMVAVGVLIGIANGFLVSYIGMNPFITTLGMSIVLTGLAVIVSKGRTIAPLSDDFRALGAGEFLGIPASIIFAVVLYIVFHVILTYTPFGRQLYAVGGNETAARASGIDTRFIILLAYVTSGILCALAGWILAGRLNSASPVMTSDILLFTFAAAVLGGVSLSGGEGKVTGVLGGVLLLSAISNLMNLVRISPFVIQVATGLIIIFAIFVSTVKRGHLLREA